MTPQRYDIYRLIHKGIRSYLTETLLAIGRMDPHETAHRNGALNQLEQLLTFCMGHLQHENAFVHPAMDRVKPGCAESMYDHHQHHEAMIRDLRRAATELKIAEPTERDALAAELYRTLAVFVADNLAHMHEEETVNNAILWAGYRDEEIMAIEHALGSSLTPEENAQTMEWMLPAMNHQERCEFLAGMRQGAPREVFDGTLAIARQQLAAGEWGRLELALAG